MSHHLLTNFESQKHYQKEPRFIGVYFRDNLPRRGLCNKFNNNNEKDI